MQTIEDARSMTCALDAPIDPQLRQLLLRRRDQLLADAGAGYDLGDLVRFLIVEPADTIAEIEAAANYPLITEPAFEWVADHGDWLEAVTVLSDDGFGIVLLVPDCEGIDATLLNLLRDLAGGTTDDLHRANLA